MHLLSRSEEIVLLAVWKLRENAYGVTIREQVAKATGFPWTIGAIYAPLHRLEKKGYVKTRPGAPVKERGGRSKVFYEITTYGKKALMKTKGVHDASWSAVLDLGLEEA